MTAATIELKELTSTDTGKSILSHFASRARTTSSTDLRRLKYLLLNNGNVIEDKEYLGVFKLLQNKGVGAIIYGRKGKPDRFKWNYSLKVISQNALSGLTFQEPSEDEELPLAAEPVFPEQTTEKRKPGRPRGSKNKSSKKAIKMIAKSKVETKKRGRPAKAKSEMSEIKSLLQDLLSRLPQVS